MLELIVHRLTWRRLDCLRTFVVDVKAHFSGINVVALNTEILLLSETKKAAPPVRRDRFDLSE